MLKSRTTIESSDSEGAAAELHPLIHPGEILLEEFLGPMGISQYRLAHAILVPPRRINEIVHGTRAISADTALRLGRFFGMEPEFWMRLQSAYELRAAQRLLADRLDHEVTPLARS